jgi:hypothetical protein
MTADKVITLRGISQPTAGEALCATSAWRTMFFHEALEESPASFLVFRDVPLQCRYRHSAHVADCERGGNRNSQCEPFDVAVEFPWEECSLQARVHEIMVFDRNENGLEAHGDLPFDRVPPLRVEIGRGFSPFARDQLGERSVAILSRNQQGKLDRSSPIT